MRLTAFRRARRTARAIAAVTVTPPYVPPGHFYSPLTSGNDIPRAFACNGAPSVDLNADTQIAIASSMQSFLSAALPGPRYYSANNMFGPSDAAVYRGFLHLLRPSRIIEVGSGFSTAVVLDEVDTRQDLAGIEITCIEPYPSRLLGLLQPSDQVTLLRCPVQDVPMDQFAKLESSDILFIDSSHVAKAGSDVAWLLLQVLPRLAPGVTVHVHDIFWPFTYPAGWLQERRDWNEAYFLHAFLSGNTSWEIMLFSSWLWHEHPECVPPRVASQEPGSIWLRKLSPP